MDQQLDLMGGAKTIGRTAPRQDAVLEFLAQHPDGISVDEAGQAAHASSGKHSVDELCAYCAIDGKSILRALEKKQLIRRTVNGQFALKTADPEPDGSFGEIPY